MKAYCQVHKIPRNHIFQKTADEGSADNTTYYGKQHLPVGRKGYVAYFLPEEADHNKAFYSIKFKSYDDTTYPGPYVAVYGHGMGGPSNYFVGGYSQGQYIGHYKSELPEVYASGLRKYITSLNNPSNLGLVLDACNREGGFCYEDAKTLADYLEKNRLPRPQWFGYAPPYANLNSTNVIPFYNETGEPLTYSDVIKAATNYASTYYMDKALNKDRKYDYNELYSRQYSEPALRQFKRIVHLAQRHLPEDLSDVQLKQSPENYGFKTKEELGKALRRSFIKRLGESPDPLSVMLDLGLVSNINQSGYIDPTRYKMFNTTFRLTPDTPSTDKSVFENAVLKYDRLRKQYSPADAFRQLTPNEQQYIKYLIDKGNIYVNRPAMQFSKYSAENRAVGIPDRDVLSDPSKLKVGNFYDMILQEHLADRAGKHYDLRIGGPEGLHSWAVRKGLPKPGKKHLAILQPLHEYEYKDFEGEIKEGYGKGKVKLIDKNNILITKVTPTELSFVIADKRAPESFKLIQTKDKQWLLINTTPIRYDTLERNVKPKYTIVDPDKAEQLIDGMHAVSAKIDGASALIEFLGDGIEIVSYRRDKSGRPISYVHKMQLTGYKPDPKLKGTVARAEVFGERKGRAITAQELSGLLNATIANSIAIQKARDINLKAAIFDIVESPVFKTGSYRDRLHAIDKIINMLPSNKFIKAPTAVNPKEALKLYNQIKTGKHPLTSEGVVITELDNPAAVPAKVKFKKDYDVVIRNIFPAVTKSGKPRAGGFEYSLPDSEEIIGRVGTGFTHDILQDMLENPDAYIGRIARVSAQEQFPSGALRAPSFISLHEG